MGVRESSGALALHARRRQVLGLPLDVCQHVLADIQKQLGLAKLDIKYQPVTSQNRIPLVQNGTVDIECGSTTNNATRQKDVAFAPTTYVEEVRIAVKANSGITSITQLDGKTVATTTGTTSVQLLRKHERATGVDFKEVFGKDHADSFLLLESGRADAFVMDGQILAGNDLASPRTRPTSRSSARCCRSSRSRSCIRKDDPAFKKAVDDSIVAHDQERRSRPSSTTSGSCSRSRRATPRSACRRATRPRLPGRTRTTSRWRTTRRSERATGKP